MTSRSLLPILILSSLMAFPSKLSAASTGLDYNLHMSDCENQWIVLSRKALDEGYTCGFVYIDPEAGLTLQIAGSFTIDANGTYRAAPNPLASDKYNVKVG